MTTTQTPSGELTPSEPPPEHARPTVTTLSAVKAWEPGDPLHAPSAYRQGLFSFREDGGHWSDAAHWYADGGPGVDRHLAEDGDELGDFIAGWHAWDQAGRPEPSTSEVVLTLPSGYAPSGPLSLLAGVVGRAVAAAIEDEAAAARLWVALHEPIRSRLSRSGPQ